MGHVPLFGARGSASLARDLVVGSVTNLKTSLAVCIASIHLVEADDIDIALSTMVLAQLMRSYLSRFQPH